MTGGTDGSDLGKYGLFGTEISFFNKTFFSDASKFQKILMSLSIKDLGIRRPDGSEFVLVRSL